jgi:sulfate/thiosulfate transport system permease protein
MKLPPTPVNPKLSHPKPSRPRTRRLDVLPGRRLSLGYAAGYLGLLVLLPIAALVLKALSISPERFAEILLNPQVLASFRVSLVCSLIAAAVNGIFGFLVAWVLVRYRFPTRGFWDALVDLPFALPTAVAGIALTAIYAPTGPIGSLLQPLGIQVAFTPLGIALALSFIGLPFVVRTLQPVLEELEPELEEAAACLGANRWQVFRMVLIPTLLPAWITGMSLAFARGLGEYGSVIFIAGNLPFKTEIVPLIIAGKLERFDYEGATVVAVAMLALSFTLLLLTNLLQRWTLAKREAET